MNLTPKSAAHVPSVEAGLVLSETAQTAREAGLHLLAGEGLEDGIDDACFETIEVRTSGAFVALMPSRSSVAKGRVRRTASFDRSFRFGGRLTRGSFAEAVKIMRSTQRKHSRNERISWRVTRAG
jgi:hypothetical protein